MRCNYSGNGRKVEADNDLEDLIFVIRGFIAKYPQIYCPFKDTLEKALKQAEKLRPFKEP